MSRPLPSIRNALLGAAVGALSVFLIHISRDLAVASVDLAVGDQPVAANNVSELTPIASEAITQPLLDSSQGSGCQTCTGESCNVDLSRGDRASAFPIAAACGCQPVETDVPIVLIPNQPAPTAPEMPLTLARQRVASTPGPASDAQNAALHQPIRRKPQTCIVRDPETLSPMLTLTLAGQVASSEIEHSSSDQSINRCSSNQLTSEAVCEPACGHNWSRSVAKRKPAAPVAPQLAVDFERSSGRIAIEADNIEITDLVASVARRTGKPIQCSRRVEGTISASVKSEHPDLALRRLLEPFGYSVHDHGSFLYISTVGEPASPQPIVKPYIAQQPMERQPAQLASVALPQRLPPATAIHPAAMAQSEYPPAAAGKVMPPGQQVMTVSAVVPASYPTTDSQPSVAGAPTPTGEVAAAYCSAEQCDRRLVEPALHQEASQPQVSEGETKIADLAQDAFSVGRTNYAIDVLAEGVIRFPSSSLLLRLLGEGYFLHEDFATAETALVRAVATDKKDYYANELLGKVLAKLGQPERANHYLMQAKCLQDEALR